MGFAILAISLLCACSGVQMSGFDNGDYDVDLNVDRSLMNRNEAINKRTSNIEDADQTNGLAKNGTNVCYWTDTVSRMVQVATFEDYPAVEITKVCCFGICRNPTCEKTRIVIKKKQVYHMVTKYIDRRNYHCCSGWKRENPTATECLTPICNPSCQNGGLCVKPDTCECVNGFVGKFCQNDDDECRTPKNNCQQTCINENPGFRCACQQGYTLNEDGKTCSDNDECAYETSPCSCEKDDGFCKANCTNTPGSFRCQCNAGYVLESSRRCKDRDECVENPTLCDHACVNTPGSYKCTCFKGFQYNAVTKKCEDVDECLTNTSGCSDLCHNVQGSYLCSCPDLFYLDKDQRTCKELSSSMNSVLVCDNNMTVISCTYPQKVAIIDAFYGRFSDQVCQYGNYTSDLRCRAENSFDKIKTCTNKVSCVLMPWTSIFGDPCPKVSKYLRVVYDCL